MFKFSEVELQALFNEAFIVDNASNQLFKAISGEEKSDVRVSSLHDPWLCMDALRILPSNK